MSTSQHPLPQRSGGVTSRAVGDGFVVIEPQTETAHSLEGLAAQVWRSLEDGTTPTGPADEVDAVLAQLSDLGLLTAPTSGVSRRSVLKKSGYVVAGAGIATIALPPSIAAASPGVGTGSGVFGKTTPGPIFIQIPANPNGTLRTITVAVAGGGGGGAAAATGGAGAAFSFSIRQAGSAPAFSLYGYVGAGGAAGTSSGTGGTGGASSASGPGTLFNAKGGDGGAGTRRGGGGGGATYVTDSTGALIAVAAGGGGGGGNNAANTANAGGNGGDAASIAANQGGAPNNSNGGIGADGADNDVAVVVRGFAGDTAARTTSAGARTAGSAGLGGSDGTPVGVNGTSGSGAGNSGAGGNGGTSPSANAGSGGGGGGHAGGGGAGSGSSQGTSNGGGGGGNGGSNFIAQAGTYSGFTIIGQNTAGGLNTPRAAAGANGKDGSVTVTVP